MEVNYTYSKHRREFGKQCRFTDYGPIVLTSVMPDLSLEDQWIPKNPVNKSTNNSVQWSEHEVAIDKKLNITRSHIFVVNKNIDVHMCFVCAYLMYRRIQNAWNTLSVGCVIRKVAGLRI